MKIIYKKGYDLIEYEYNNKDHPEEQIKILAKSIKEFGFNQPIVIDKNNTIVAGHGRLKAGLSLKIEKFPCIMVDNLTSDQVRKYRLLDNKIAELAEDNIENIKLELDELNDMTLNELYLNTDDFKDIDFDNIESNEDRGVNDKTEDIECPDCGCAFSI